ncbi:hypothetical protein [Lonepinella sp. MS14436]|uniref:hypothetical protein n=1 Tax=Lonepinella sp. MS14436 TaxID=3003619 RepID=UPI0036DE27B2
MKSWFEIIESNLNSMDEEKRKLTISLIKDPLSVDESSLRKHISNVLLGDFLKVLKWIKTILSNNKPIFSLFASEFGIEIYFYNDNKKEFIENYELILNDYKERAKEDLERKRGLNLDELPSQVKVNLYILYSLSDLLVYILSDVLIINGNGRYELNDEYYSSYKMIWFSRYFAQQSHISDFLIQIKLNVFEVTSREDSIFQNWVDIALDKYLSINPNYIKFLDENDRLIFSSLRKVAEFVILLSLFLGQEIIKTKQINIVRYIDVRDLISFGFSDGEISRFFADIDKLDLPKCDRIFTKIDDDTIRINNINLKFALQVSLRNYLISMKGRGRWFETEYILKYLGDNIDKGRFLITKGINDPKEKYDSDILIYDKDSGLIYFCQIKHRIDTIHPFFRDEFSEYCTNSQLLHGVEQLNTLKSKISTSNVKERLISRLGKNIVNKLDIKKSSRFLLLHSIENLDMCTKNGIAMYEWNTFRNLLKGEITAFKNSNFNSIIYSNKLMDFSKIINIQEYLINEFQKVNNVLRSDYGPAKQWEVLKGARVSFVFNISIGFLNKSIFKFKQKYWDMPLIS